MNKNTNNPPRQQPIPQPIRQTKGDGGGAPGPKYTIPCPKPKK